MKNKIFVKQNEWDSQKCSCGSSRAFFLSKTIVFKIQVSFFFFFLLQLAIATFHELSQAQEFRDSTIPMLFLHERILRKESRRRCQNGFKDVLYGQRLTTSWRKVSSSFCQTYLISGISNSNAFFAMDNRGETKKCARTNVIIFLNGTTMTLKTLFLWWALGRNDTNVQTFMFMSFHRIHSMLWPVEWIRWLAVDDVDWSWKACTDGIASIDSLIALVPLPRRFPPLTTVEKAIASSWSMDISWEKKQ